MISRSRRLAGRLAAASASRTVSTTRPLRNCVGERLTETLTSPGHAAQATHARRSTLAPNSFIRPSSSTIGMNSAGETRPRTGWFQRASASKPEIWRVATSTIGWKWTSIASFATAARRSSSMQAADLDLGVHRLLERTPIAAPFRLGGVERHVGVGEDRFGRLAVLRRARRADAGADDDFITVDEHRPTDFAQDLLGELAGLAGIGDRALQDGEFVAAPARDDVGVAHDPLQPVGDRGVSSLSPRAWPRLSLTCLKSSRSRNRTLALSTSSARLRRRRDELLFEATAIGQLGDGIDARHAIDRRRGVAPFGDVLDDDDDALPLHAMNRDFDRALVDGSRRRDDVVPRGGVRTALPHALDLGPGDDLAAHQCAKIARRPAPDLQVVFAQAEEVEKLVVGDVRRSLASTITRPCDMLLRAMSSRLANMADSERATTSAAKFARNRSPSPSRRRREG